MRILTLPLPILLCAIFLSACDLAHDNDPLEASSRPFTIVSGQLFETPLANMSYHSTHFSGVTSSLGLFLYKPNESIRFSLGNYQFPKIKAEPTLDLLTLLQAKEINASVLNLSRLLDSISLNTSQETLALPDLNEFDLSRLNFSQAPLNFANDRLVLNVLTKYGNQQNPLKLVTYKKALNKLLSRYPHVASNLPAIDHAPHANKLGNLFSLVADFLNGNDAQKQMYLEPVSLASMAGAH